MDKGCTCQKCGKVYKVDILIPDEIWELITPKSNGGGLLCGSCIMKSIEAFDEFNAFKLIKV